MRSNAIRGGCRGLSGQPQLLFVDANKKLGSSTLFQPSRRSKLSLFIFILATLPLLSDKKDANMSEIMTLRALICGKRASSQRSLTAL